MSKFIVGNVVSLKMQKTAVVNVVRKFRHRLYKKTLTRHKKYKAHLNEDLKLELGDMVELTESRPISKGKHFIVVKKI